MNNEEKILKMLEKMQNSISDMKNDISDLKSGQEEIKNEMVVIRKDILRVENKLDNLEAHNAERHLDMNRKINYVSHKLGETEKELFIIKDIVDFKKS